MIPVKIKLIYITSGNSHQGLARIADKVSAVIVVTKGIQKILIRSMYSQKSGDISFPVVYV